MRDIPEKKLLDELRKYEKSVFNRRNKNSAPSIPSYLGEFFEFKFKEEQDVDGRDKLSQKWSF